MHLVSKGKVVTMEEVKRNISAISSKLLKADDSTVWWTEEVVSRALGLKATVAAGQRESLTLVLVSIKKGYSGDARRKKYSTGVLAADLNDENNGTSVRVVKHGRALYFDGGTLTELQGHSQPRYFSFGTPRFDITDQINIAHAIVGNDPSLLQSARERRKSNFRKWFLGESDDGGFSRFDVPAIAVKYLDCWSELDVEVNHPPAPFQLQRRAFDVGKLATIEKDMKAILASFGLATSRYRCNLPYLFKQNALDAEVEEDEEMEEDGDGEEDVDTLLQDTTQTRRPRWTSPSGTPYPDNLRLSALRCCTESGRVDFDKADELASVEYMLHLYYEKDVVAALVPKVMEENAVTMPMTVTVDDLVGLSGRSLAAAHKQVAAARSNLLFAFGGDIFQPKDDEHLYQWLQDARYVHIALPLLNYIILSQVLTSVGNLVLRFIHIL